MRLLQMLNKFIYISEIGTSYTATDTIFLAPSLIQTLPGVLFQERENTPTVPGAPSHTPADASNMML